MINAFPPRVSQMRFTSAGGSGTLLYYFINKQGVRVSDHLTLSPASAVVPLPEATIPDGAVAIRCRADTADDICYSLVKVDGTDESVANINTFADYIPSDYAVTLGKVYD